MAEVCISLDGMGGDNAPGAVLSGAAEALRRRPHLRFLIFGDESTVSTLLERYPDLRAVSEIRHTTDAVRNDDKPASVLRKRRESSMRKAIDAVKAGEAAAVVSGGNTGALMATAKFVFKTLPGVDRPAIASVMPSIRGQTVMLDMGANVVCNAHQLYQFALMGEAFARAVLGLERPTVGLLNVGQEELKGHEEVREAAHLLKNPDLHMDFCGFVEGDDIGAGTVDVVVTDGFTGNISLKTAEGTGKMIYQFIRHAFRSSLSAKLAYLVARPALKQLFHQIDPRQYNGALFLGLNGVAIKSHGGTDATGFAAAIEVAADTVEHKLNEKICEEIRIAAGQTAGVAEQGAA